MSFPTWEEILGGPCFVVNMDRCTERWTHAWHRARAAGFTDVQRLRAVDATKDDLADVWASHGSPRFAPDPDFLHYPGQQGCMLSHLNLWRHMIDHNLPFAMVLEDDALFHSQWATLAPAFYEATPKDFHILYMGCQIEYPMGGDIQRTPLFCTHAYFITLAGAKHLYEYLLHHTYGVRTIDCMLYEAMKAHILRHEPRPFSWYAWSAQRFPDPQQPTLNPHWAKRNSGLVFQDETLGTFIKPRNHEPVP